MVKFNTSYGKVQLDDGRLLDPDHAERLAKSIEDAVRVAEYYEENIPDKYNIDGELVRRLANPDPSEDIRVWVELNRKGSDDDEEEVELNDLRRVCEDMEVGKYSLFVLVTEVALPELLEVDNVFYLSEHGFRRPEPNYPVSINE